MSDYEFELPFPPSVNAVWKPFKNRLIMSKRGRDYRQAVIEACEALNIKDEALGCELKVLLTLNPPTLRRYDIDNFNKALFDGLTHAGFWVDDEQVIELTIKKGKKTKGGNIKVKVDIRKGE